MAVEIDGATHSTDAEIQHDAKRTAFLTSKGWGVMRFDNDHIYNQLDLVLSEISDKAQIL